MRRALSSATSSKLEDEIQSELKEEHANLTRQYRITEDTRAGNLLGYALFLKRQENIKTKLRAEQADIAKTLKIAQSNFVAKKDADNFQELGTLAQAQKVYTEIVKNERGVLENLRAKIKNIEEQIEKQQQKNGGAISSHERHVSRIKRTRVLENRVNTATVQFNKLLTENSGLRTQIEHYRSQRKVFNTLYKRLTTKLDQQKSQIAVAIEQATVCYEQRDDANTKMISLQEKNNNDLNHFTSEYKEMNRIIAHETNLQKFMDTKNCELNELATVEANKRRQSHDMRTETLQEAEMCKFEKVLQAIINVLGLDHGKKIQDLLFDAGKSKVNKKHMLDAIKPICERYKKTEDQNLSLFTFVNEISQDIKRLEEKIRVQQQSTTESKKHMYSSKKHSEDKYVLYQTELNRHTNRQEEMAVLIKNYKQKHDKLCGHVIKLFNALSCDNDNIKTLLGEQNLTNQNLDLFLSSIENRLNTLTEWQLVENVREESERETGSRNENRRTPADGARRQTLHKVVAQNNSTEFNNISSLDAVEAKFSSELDKVPLSIDALRNRAKVLMDDKTRNARTTTPKSVRSHK